ncbi:MAG: hypothetical protein AAFY11_04550 [Cyanobacteria bacterium J06641_5]
MIFIFKVLGLAIAISAAIKVLGLAIAPLEPNVPAAIAAVILPVVGLAALLLGRHWPTS